MLIQKHAKLDFQRFQGAAGIGPYMSLLTDEQEQRGSSFNYYGSPGWVLPYIGYIGMCGPKGYGFSAVLVINRVSILADFGHFGHKWGMVFAL